MRWKFKKPCFYPLYPTLIFIFQNWSDEKLKIHVEEGIFPNLEGKVDFELQDVVADAVLIQGKVTDQERGVVYVGPAYIPHSVRSLQIPVCSI